MRAKIRTEVFAAALLAACTFSATTWADAVVLGTYNKLGNDVDATVSGGSNGGATMTYATDTDSRYDSGVFSYTDSAKGGVTFANVGDKLTYNFTYTGIVASGNLGSPQFRTGFDFGSTAFLYHTTSVGTQSQLAFRSNDNGNPFASGDQTGDTIMDWSDSAHKEIRFDDGNVINGTVSLSLHADNGNGTYDYLYEVTYVNGATSNSASQVFSGVTGNNVVNLVHLSNVSTMSVADDTWTVTGASAEFTVIPEPASNLVATSPTAGTVHLTWNDNSDNEEGFIVEQSTDGGAFSEIGTTTEASYSVTGLDPAKSYRFRVKAYNAAGSSDYTMTASPISPTSSGVDLRAFVTAEGVVVELTAHDVESDGEIQLMLLNEAGDPIWFGSERVAAGSAAYVRFVVPGLEPGGRYAFNVRDEVGKWWDANGVCPRVFAAEMTRATLAGVTLSFDSLPDHQYEVQWVQNLGRPWKTVATITASGLKSSALVPWPNPTNSVGFYRVRLQ